MDKEIIFLTGPTAVGKSALAVRLAERINAEIISCDSMQVYRDMDIITCKPSAECRRSIRHHLLDIVSPEEDYNVSRYYADAVEAVNDILLRGKTPLFVGGTGLYVSILVDGIFSSAPEDQELRQRLYSQAQTPEGALALHQRLMSEDPLAAARIHPNDLRRVIRALEVKASSGKTISLLQKERAGLSALYPLKIFCLNLPRQELYARVERRIDEMFSLGLEAEVRALSQRALSRNAAYAIGITELKGFFEGKYGIEEARRLMKLNTRHYAKRQLTWFRKDKRIVWIEAQDTAEEEVLNLIWKKLS